MKTLALTCLLALSALLRANDSAAVNWPEIKRAATVFVEAESPESVWPFERPDYEVLTGQDKLVFAHFFSPFPLSFDNKATAEDTYSNIHLSPEGSDQHLKGRGGYKQGGGGALRQRPLPAGPWESNEWKRINLAVEVLRARKLGLDGFTYDMLGVSPGNEHRRILEMLLEVAEHVAPGFKVVLMPDMNAELKRKPEILVDAIRELAHYQALYRLPDGRLLISPYNGSAQPPGYWSKLMQELAVDGISTAFLPVFVGYEHMAKNGELYKDIAYGMSDWGFRDITFAEEYDFANSAAHAKPYTDVWMFPVAPQDVRAKGLIAWEPENTRAFRYLWDAAMEGGSPIVQIVTWNDYSEASEISPSSGTQFAFYDLTAYYTIWYKTGTAPAITQDAIYYTHRPQIFPFPEGVVAEKQRKPFSRIGKTDFVNNVEMVALLTAPATLEIEQNGKTETMEADAGLATFDVPLQEGRPVFRIVRDGKRVVETESHWPVTLGGSVENPIYHGGSSTRSFVPTPGYRH